MKRILSYLLFLSVLGIASCKKDETTLQVTADFEATVTGNAPDAKLVLVNKSTNATGYSWTFSEGASVSESTEKEPASIIIDKAGELTITLASTNGSNEGTKTITVNVAGKNGLAEFKDVEFSLSAGSVTYGRFFSTANHKMYKDSEVNATVGPKIDIAFVGQIGLNYFVSPNDSQERFNIPGATTTKFMNYAQSILSAADFDAMVDNSKLDALVITETNDSFGTTITSPFITLFENAAGKKGAIKIKSINNSRLLVDIKVEKY